MKNHNYTVEILYHFSCNLCNQWWTYAYTPTRLHDYNLNLPNNESVHCMHCGHTTIAEVKPNVHVPELGV